MAEATEKHPTIRDVAHVRREIANTANVSPWAWVGTPGEWRDRASMYPAIIGHGCIIREGVRVHAGCERPTSIGDGTLLMSGSHVGHDVTMGPLCEVAPNAVIGGCATIGRAVKIGMNATVLPHVHIGDGARIGAGSVVNRDVPPGETWVGVPARRIR